MIKTKEEFKVERDESRYTQTVENQKLEVLVDIRDSLGRIADVLSMIYQKKQ